MSFTSRPLVEVPEEKRKGISNYGDLLSLAREYKLGDDASRDLFHKGAKLISKIKPILLRRTRRLISKDVASDGPYQDGPYFERAPTYKTWWYTAGCISSGISRRRWLTDTANASFPSTRKRLRLRPRRGWAGSEEGGEIHEEGE